MYTCARAHVGAYVFETTVWITDSLWKDTHTKQQWWPLGRASAWLSAQVLAEHESGIGWRDILRSFVSFEFHITWVYSWFKKPWQTFNSAMEDSERRVSGPVLPIMAIAPGWLWPWRGTGWRMRLCRGQIQLWARGGLGWGGTRLSQKVWGPPQYTGIKMECLKCQWSCKQMASWVKWQAHFQVSVWLLFLPVPAG